MEAAQQLQRQLKELDDLRAQKVENLRKWNKYHQPLHACWTVCVCVCVSCIDAL
jgi:hypothetical protein